MKMVQVMNCVESLRILTAPAPSVASSTPWLHCCYAWTSHADSMKESAQGDMDCGMTKKTPTSSIHHMASGTLSLCHFNQAP